MHSFRASRPIARSILLFTLCLLGGCNDAPRESVGSSSSAIYGGTTDSSDANADVVVALTQYSVVFDETFYTVHCSGTLISPLVVLTAGHCVVGATSDVNSPHFEGGGSGGVQISVQQIGSAKLNTFFANPDNPMTAVLTAPVDGSDAETAEDIALIFLDPGGEDQPTFKDILELFIERPSFTVPSSTVNGSSYTFSPPLGIAGFTGTTTRTEGSLDVNKLEPQTWGAFWDNLETGISSDSGDSGGPLFALHGDGSRDAVGVISQGGHSEYGAETKMADLTNAKASAWVKSKVVDPPSAHTQTWLCKHHAEGCSGKTYPSRWLGEVDYVGPCQPSMDADCDHWFDANDNCPSVFNPSQADSDDDGFGDACPCPCDTGNGLQDYDGDGVCAVACSWQKTDNCPKVANPDQANCNSDSEIAQGLPVWGDACDPVPCPASNADATTDVVEVCSGNPVIGGSCTGRKIHDEIDTTGTAAHQFDWDSTKGHNPFHPDSIGVPGVKTEMRFCQSNLTLGFDCHAAANIGDAHLTDPESAPPNPAYVWHEVTQGTCSGSCYSALTDDARGSTYSMNYTDTTEDVHGWDYAVDSTYWTSGNLIPAPGDYPGCTGTVVAGTCLDGTWWSHADTPVGDSTTPTYDMVTVGSHGDQLANHYFDLRPDSLFTTNFVGLGNWHLIMLWRTLPDPATDEQIQETRFLVSDPSGSQLGVLQNDGTSAQIPSDGLGAILSPKLTPTLAATSTVWASAVEPSPNTGMVDSRVEAVALSSDGTTMLAVALSDNGVLRIGDEVGFPEFVTRTTASHPPARTGPLAFFSSAAGGVFMLGGVDPTGAGFMHDMWFRQMHNDWRPVPAFGYAPDRILAATFSFADRRLYVLDHTVDGSVDTAHLVRIDFRTGLVESLGSCPRGTTYTTQFLTLDIDGSVLLTSTSATASAIGHLAVDCNGKAYLSQIDSTEGGLAVAPVVDPNGYSLVTTTATGGYITTRTKTLQYGSPGKIPLANMFP
jgi:hypothetical protein